ncbi:hypothetical protein Tco_0090692 [Tanacetum coccineum]
MKEVSADPNLSTLEFQALETENTQLKEELTAVRIKNDSLRDENVSIKKRYQDLYKSKPKVLAPGLYAMTRIKSVTEASKSKSKCETKTHRNLPARSENVKRVDNPLRNLNKRNHVDSSLRVKRTRFNSRITKPEVVPLEKSGSVSTSEPVNNVIVTPRFSKKPLTSYKRKDSKLKDTSIGSPPNVETKVVNDPVNANDLSANQ